jgi:hypothetical protein
MQHVPNLPPSVSRDPLSSNVGEEDNSCKALLLPRPFVEVEHSHYLARPGSIGERPESSIEHLDMWSNAS